MGGAEFIIILLPIALGFIPMAIASGKGRAETPGQKFGWWLFGALFFLIALIVALVISPRQPEVPPPPA